MTGWPDRVRRALAAGDAVRRDEPSDGDGPTIARVRRRLVIWSGGITLAIIVVLGSVTYVSVASSLSATGEALVRERAESIERLIERSPGFDRLPPGGAPFGFAFGGPASGSVAFVVGPGGRTFGPERPIDGLPNAAGLTAATESGRDDVREIDADGLALRVLTRPVVAGSRTYLVQIADDRTDEARTLAALLTVLVAAGAAAVALAVLGGTVYASRALVPIRESMRRQRQFAADASHELRTPLAVVRANVQHLERHPESRLAEVAPALTDIRSEVDHLTDLVDALLLLARADSGVVDLQHVPTDLADVAASALGGLDGLARERGVQLSFDAVPVQISGDPVRLRQLVAILVDNAIRHAPSGGHAHVRVSRAAGGVELEVADDGPGIRAADLPHLFERFWRAPDAPEGGSGLGLSIAAWIAERHGGRITADNVPDAGARFRVSLPAGPAR